MCGLSVLSHSLMDVPSRIAAVAVISVAARITASQFLDLGLGSLVVKCLWSWPCLVAVSVGVGIFC